MVEDRLAGKTWWFDDQLSAMDAYIFWVWFRITGYGFDMTPFPNWQAQGAAMLARSGVQRAVENDNEMQATLEAEGLAPKMM